MSGKRGQVSRPNLVDMKLRLPADLRATIEKAAKANGSSMNGEIVARLEAGDGVEKALGSNRDVQVWAAMQREIESMENLTGKRWTDDIATFAAAQSRIRKRLEEMQPQAENEVEIKEAWHRFYEAQSKAFEMARMLEDQGALHRRQNALSPNVTNSNHSNKAMDHAGVYFGGEYGGMLGAAWPEETRKQYAAIAYLGFSIGVSLTDAPETWSLFDKDGKPLPDTEKLAIAFLVKLLPARVEEAVEARDKYNKARGDFVAQVNKGLAIASTMSGGEYGT